MPLGEQPDVAVIGSSFCVRTQQTGTMREYLDPSVAMRRNFIYLFIFTPLFGPPNYGGAVHLPTSRWQCVILGNDRRELPPVFPTPPRPPSGSDSLLMSPGWMLVVGVFARSTCCGRSTSCITPDQKNTIWDSGIISQKCVQLDPLH